MTLCQALGMILRTATTGDLPAVLRFWSSAAENAARPADTPVAAAALAARDPDALILAVDGDVIIGTVIAGWDGWRGHLYRLAVHPDRRREGIGRALLARAEQRLAALGASRADAMVLDGNELGHKIWVDAGYDRQPDWSRWVKPLP
jgi:ribosomal protein S18 acetylase RimI-like enzyme